MKVFIGNYIKTSTIGYGRVISKDPTEDENNPSFDVIVHQGGLFTVIEAEIEVVSKFQFTKENEEGFSEKIRFNHPLNDYLFGDAPTFVDGSLLENYEMMLESVPAENEIFDKILENKDFEPKEFTEEEGEAIETHVEMLNDSYEGDIDQSSWFYLPKHEEIVTWLNGDTGFNFTCFDITEVDMD